MSNEAIQKVWIGRSVRVPEKKNPYQRRILEVGSYAVPMTSSTALYLPRICMRELVLASGHDFPCRFSKQMRERIDICVSEEGFLVPLTPLKQKELHSLQASILKRFGAYTVPYDVVRLAGKETQVIHALRLVPWSTRPSGAEPNVADETWESFNRRSDKAMLEYVRTLRAAKLGAFAGKALRKSVTSAPSPREIDERPEDDVGPSPAVSTEHPDLVGECIRLCNPKDMEARVAREPVRNNGAGGSLLTLAGLCQEKRLVRASEAHVAALAALHEKLPNFSPLIDFLQRKLNAQQLCGNPIRMSPILLVGDPGVGKSYFCRQLAEALGMPFEFIAVAGSGQELHITGLSKSWHGAGASRFAEILADSPIANPLIMVDEIDKAGDIRVENALLQIFEPETAARWIDQYVEVPIDLSRTLLVATANDETQLSPILLSRFEVFDIQKPEDTALAAVFNSIYADEKQQFRTTALFSEHLSGAVIEKLIQSSMTPREARRLLLNAMELAIIRTHREHGQLPQGSVVVQPDDMPLPHRVEPTSRIGFI